MLDAMPRSGEYYSFDNGCQADSENGISRSENREASHDRHFGHRAKLSPRRHGEHRETPLCSKVVTMPCRSACPSGRERTYACEGLKVSFPRGDAEVDFRALLRALRASAGTQNVTSQAKKVYNRHGNGGPPTSTFDIYQSPFRGSVLVGIPRFGYFMIWWIRWGQPGTRVNRLRIGLVFACCNNALRVCLHRPPPVA